METRKLQRHKNKTNNHCVRKCKDLFDINMDSLTTFKFMNKMGIIQHSSRRDTHLRTATCRDKAKYNQQSSKLSLGWSWFFRVQLLGWAVGWGCWAGKGEVWWGEDVLEKQTRAESQRSSDTRAAIPRAFDFFVVI